MAANDPLEMRTVPGGPGADARDIRERLRQDHEATLAEVERLRAGKEDPQSSFLLRELRRAWVIHALAEETVVYRALEGAEGRVPPDTLAGERFVEHELIEGLFEKLSRVKPGSLESRPATPSMAAYRAPNTATAAAAARPPDAANSASHARPPHSVSATSGTRGRAATRPDG